MATNINTTIETLNLAFERIRRRAKELALNAAGDDKFDVHFKTTHVCDFGFKITHICDFGDLFLEVEGNNSETHEWIRAELVDVVKEELERIGAEYGGEEKVGGRIGVFWVYTRL